MLKKYLKAMVLLKYYNLTLISLKGALGVDFNKFEFSVSQRAVYVKNNDKVQNFNQFTGFG